MSRIRGVTFDAGGTLIEPWPSVGAVYAEVAARFGLACVPASLDAQFAGAWRGRTVFRYTREEWFELVRQSFAGAGEVSSELFDAIYARFAEASAWIIYDDVIPALQELEKAGLKLAVISNWDERLKPLLGQLGLSTYFSHVINSSAVAAHKPESQIFQKAAELLGLAPSEILHVGDSEREDVQGARGAGMAALRIRRSGAAEPHDIERLTAILGKLSH